MNADGCVTEWVGIDIGGANLKFASTTGQASSIPFPLWKQPENLSDTLKEQLKRFPAEAGIAITMTGELADCYSSKRHGVSSIVDSVESACPTGPVWFYATDGHFYLAGEAKARWQAVAAANWHGTAAWLHQALQPKPNLLIDCGSTTVDLIPFSNQGVDAKGKTDPERIRHHELVYTGVSRSPVNAVLPDYDWRGTKIGLAQEYFATMDDVYLVLGDRAESDARDTADGRPRRRKAALQRLARMLCGDLEEIGEEEIVKLAAAAKSAQRTRLGQALQLQLGKLEKQVNASGVSDLAPIEIVIAGEGAFLIKQALDTIAISNRYRLLDEIWNSEVSQAAGAFAIANLAAIQVGNASAT